MPGPGGYWLTPVRIASTAASSTAAGPSVSGKPCPRLIEPVCTASADISAKIVVPKPASFDVNADRVSGSAVTPEAYVLDSSGGDLRSDDSGPRVGDPTGVALALGVVHRLVGGFDQLAQ